MDRYGWLDYLMKVVDFVVEAFKKLGGIFE